jgi:subtilisin family serine protease
VATEQAAARIAGAPGQPEPRSREITLITGDRVIFDPENQVTGFIRAQGRENIPVQVLTSGESTEVIPADVVPLIESGTLDERLFDITELSREEYQSFDGLPIIVTYEDERPARLFAETGPEVRSTLDSINGEALTVSTDEAADLWTELTQPASGIQVLAAARGIESIVLDGIVEAALDESVAQIGAPEVWDAGYDGTGVKIAILDTGISTTHPDLADHVIAAQNFSTDADTEDNNGHGTHTASISAGNGAASDGTYTGVAPGAQLLNGKVLGSNGSGFDSGVIKGMQWAVAQGADVINMSLGSTASASISLTEAAVDALSAESDALFVVSAGNSGPGASTLSSPGTADAALTVGAVDKSDQLASFSSTGPRLRDGAIKPDVTAPGVDITAASPNGGYVALSGTSMAAPHVAGAAALLAQAHPDWTGEEIKAALIASAQTADGYLATQQGTGRINVPAALAQTVIAGSSSLNFGSVQVPDDVTPVVKDLTYRNLGDQDVTLDLSTTGNAPEGMFTLSADQVTVPARGTATVQVSADTGLAGDQYGAYLVYVIATSEAGQTVTIAGRVQRDPPLHTLTVQVTDRAGEPTDNFNAMLRDLSGTKRSFLVHGSHGTATARVPAGQYRVDTSVAWKPEGADQVTGSDLLLHPGLTITEDTTLAVDAAHAKPIKLTPPDPAASQTNLTLGLDLDSPDGTRKYPSIWLAGTPAEGFGTAALGSPLEGWYSKAFVTNVWARDGREYQLVDSQEGEFYTGLTKEADLDELALVRTELGASLPDRTGYLITAPELGSIQTGYATSLPKTTDVYVQADAGRWTQTAAQRAPNGRIEMTYSSGYHTYEAGEEYLQTYNVGVFGPTLRDGDGLYRSGNTIYGRVNLLADGAGHRSSVFSTPASTTLYRNGTAYATADTFLDNVSFEVPEDKAKYKLITMATRNGVGASVSTEVTASYTFTSAKPTGSDPVELPTTAVRFTPDLSLHSTAPAGKRFTIPVTVQGSAAGSNLDELTVSVSTNGGRTWHEAAVHAGKIKVTNPAAGGTVSLRAEVSDRKGNTLTQTIIDAYRTA